MVDTTTTKAKGAQDPADVESGLGGEAPERPDAGQREAIQRVAARGGNPEDWDPQDSEDALSWFLEDEPVDLTHTLRINVGTPGDPRWVKWTLRAIDSETLKRIRREAQDGNRRARRSRQPGEAAEIDPQAANLRIVVEGTVEPDLDKAVVQYAAKMGREAPEHPDSSVARMQIVKHRLRHKPGLIDQLSAEIMSLSGYDDDDIQELAQTVGKG